MDACFNEKSLIKNKEIKAL